MSHLTRRERRIARRVARALAESSDLDIVRRKERQEFVRMNWRAVAGEKLEA